MSEHVDSEMIKIISVVLKFAADMYSDSDQPDLACRANDILDYLLAEESIREADMIFLNYSGDIIAREIAGGYAGRFYDRLELDKELPFEDFCEACETLQQNLTLDLKYSSEECLKIAMDAGYTKLVPVFGRACAFRKKEAFEPKKG